MNADTNLTDRQKQVLKLYAEGIPVKDMARFTGRSHKTAEYHMGEIKRKLGILNPILLVHWALRRGIARLVCALFLFALPASAQYYFPTNPPACVPLAWDAPTATNVIAFHVYWGVASRQYTNFASVSGTNFARIAPLARGVTYYFSATAIDTLGLESDFSNEISYTVPAGPAPPSLRLALSPDGKLILGSAEPYSSQEIERSTDLRAWQKIGTASAAGNGSFEFSDPHPGALAFYRTRQSL